MIISLYYHYIVTIAGHTDRRNDDNIIILSLYCHYSWAY